MHQLLHNYGGRVRSVLRQELGGVLDPADLEEVLNRAAYQAWCDVSTYSADRGQLGTWFYIIARNAALTLIKREPRSVGSRPTSGVDFGSLEVDPGMVPGHGQSSLDAATTEERTEPSARQKSFVQALRACINNLSPMQRRIIRADLRSGDVANATHLAKTLRTTTNSIYVSRSSARKNLRLAMQRRGFFSDDERGKFS